MILSQRTAAQSTTLTFAALATRSAGATGNFTVGERVPQRQSTKWSSPSAPSTNQFLNAGIYFGGVDFAVYDSTGAGYVRAINYATDTNAATSTVGRLSGAVTGKISS